MKLMRNIIVTTILVLLIILSIIKINIKENNIQKYEKKIVYNEKSEDNNIDVVTFDKTIGMNGFIDDNINTLSAVGTIREYHNYRWIIESPGENRYTQGNNNYTWWYWDDYYKKLHELGITVMPCIQGTSQADVGNEYKSNIQQKPITSNENSLDPFSYSEHASTMYQFAARYGSVEVDTNNLLLAPNQVVKTGLGYIKYYEDWNEPDKTWEGEKSYFSPEEYAAMASADYDGHEGTLGNTFGIKNADPNAKLVMGGLAGNGNFINYVTKIKEWASVNRTDGKIPLDVLNFHMYVGNNSPENSNFISRIDEIVNWKKENIDDVELWLTEFGWDTSLSSPNGVSLEKQRDYLMRTYLIANAHGIDRATMYMSRDASSNQYDSQKYSTSGLTTLNQQTIKPSWYGIYTLKNNLTNYIFEEIIEENENIFIYKFKNILTDEISYVLWSPTEDGSVLENYNFNIGNFSKATLTTFKDNDINGNVSDLDVIDGNVSLTVNETPIFLKVKEEITTTTTQVITTNPTTTTNSITTTNTTINPTTTTIKSTTTNIITTTKINNTNKINYTTKKTNSITTKNITTKEENTTKNTIINTEIIEPTEEKQVVKTYKNNIIIISIFLVILLVIITLKYKIK